MRLSPLEIDILSALSRGDAPPVRSSHRLRLEMMGLVTDGPEGLRLTPTGERAAASAPTAAQETLNAPIRHYDTVGKKRMNVRVFP